MISISPLCHSHGNSLPHPTCIWCIVCDSINQSGDLDLLTSKQVYGPWVTRVTCFHPANFRLPGSFRSWVRPRHATDRQTPARAVASLQHHYHVVRHASRVPVCSSPAELDWSNERGVDQDVVSNHDQEDDQQADQSAMWAGTSFSSWAICPKTEMRRAARMSLRVVRPVHWVNRPL